MLTTNLGAVSKEAAAGLTPGRPDEGVWAYVCIAKLLQDLEMRGVCRQRGLCYLR